MVTPVKSNWNPPTASSLFITISNVPPDKFTFDNDTLYPFSPPSSPPSSDTSLAGNSNTVPSASAANNPNAGSSAKNPEANTTAEPPPSPDKGATKSAIEEPPVGAIPTT